MLDSDSLYENPSVERWVEEIRSLIRGENWLRVERLGSVDEFIETAIANSNDPTLSRRNMVEAREKIRNELPPNMLSILQIPTQGERDDRRF